MLRQKTWHNFYVKYIIMKKIYLKTLLTFVLSLLFGVQGWADSSGLTDLGQNGYYHSGWGEYAYSFQGSATTFVEGATIKIEGSATSLDCWLNDNGTGEKWKYNKFSFELSADDATQLAQTDYTFWMAAWFGNITKVTITLPNGTVVGEGGNTGGGTTTDPEGDDDVETPTTDDDPEADYSHQNDVNDDGVLEPDATNPAFGVKVNYHKYPQITDVPTIYITTGAGQDVSNLYVTKTETYYTANIVVVDKNGKMKQRNEAVTFRGRGNSTWNSGSKKKPWRLKFPSKTKFLAEYDLSAGAEINNYANAKSWTLLSNVYDKSLMRNALTAELGKRYGLEFCPAYRFVDLVINGQYLGTYQVSDQVQVDPKRVNVNSKTGWFVEHSATRFIEDPYIMPNASGQNLYVTVKNPETETVTASGESTEAKEGGAYYGMKQWLTQYWTSLTSGQYKTWRDKTDLKSLIGWFIIEDLAGNYDGAMANVYAYKEADASKLKFGPLWDLDLAYGNHNTSGHFWNAQSDGVGFLFGEMFKDPYFVKALYEQWEEFKNGNELSEFISSKVTEISGILAQTQAANYNMPEDSFHKYDSGWKIDGSLTLGSSASSYSAATSAITSYLLDPTNGRISWIETEYKKQYDALGCASLEDIDLDGDDEEETGGEEGTGPALGTEYVVPSMTFNGNYNDYNVPASAFNSAATSARVTVKNAYYIKYKLEPNAYNSNATELIEFKNTNNQPQTGTYTLTGEELEKAKAGQLYINCDGNTNITVTVLNYKGDIDTPGTDTPEPPSEETFEQLTDLPTMYLQIYKLNEDGTSDKTQTEAITTSGGAYHTARIVIVDKNGTIKERDEETEIRGRGNSTWSGDNLKNPYRLKFPTKTKLLSYLDEDGTTVINNYANAKSWTLLANKGDYSLIRNALTSELGKYLDMPFVPAYKFVDLVINGSYAGTYQISDQIQVAKDRVNVNSDTGWFLSANRGGGYEEDPYFSANGASFNIKNPEADTPTASGETTDPKYTAMKTWMTNALQTKWINETEVIDGEALANYFDMESLANYLIGIDITGDPDGSIDNFYMYKEADESSKMKFGPMWDYDLAYGNADRDHMESHFFENEGTYGWIYKVKQMYNTPTVIKAIWKRWKEVYGEYDSATGQSTLTKYLLAKVDALDAIIAQSQAKNFEAGKAGSVAGSNTYSTHAAAIAALKAWIPAHIEWLNNAYKADYKKITGLDPDACTHTYTEGKYTSNGDGTYSRECDICGMAEEDGTKFYKYTTYENGTATETFNESKTWATDNAPTNPNALVIVEYGSGITGKNIVVDNKGKYTCANFELTDGYSFYSPIKFTAVTATYTRNVSNDWGTICLPYKVQTVEADDATYYQLKNVGKDNSTLVFEVAKSSGAYTPLVFKRKSGSSITVTATDVTVKATSEDKTNSTVADWTLIGTMEQKNFADVKSELASNEQLYYIAQNKFWQATTTYTNNPFRAYFIYTPSTPSAAKVSMFSISTDDNLATGITSANATRPLAIFTNTGSVSIVAPKDMKVSIYSANGMLVETINALKDTEYSVNLAAGIYMVNGLKFVVK